MSINFMHTTDFERFYIKHRDANLANNRLENLEIIKRNVGSKPLHFRYIVDDRYTVTDTGHIFRNADGSELVGSVNSVGYRISSFSTKQNIYKQYTFHQIIATLFVPNPNPQIYNIVNHIDGDKLNNDVLNLEWCNQAINSNHAAYIQHMTKISVEEIDMIRNMLLDEKHHGSAASVYDAIHHKFPHITLKMIYAIKHKAAYNRSNIFDVNDIRFPVYTKPCIPTEDLDMVRDILLTPECLYSPTKAYKSIDHSRYPYITESIIGDIKHGTKSYRRSNKYDIDELDKLFKANQQPWRGVCQKMKAIERNDNRTLDLCRKLLQLRVFRGSIQAVYNAIDKTSHPNITINVLKHVKYDDVPSSPYYRTDSMDLDRFYTDMKNGIFHVASREFIDELTTSYSHGNSDITDEAFDEILEDYISEHGEMSRPFLRVNKSDDLTTLQQTLPKCYQIMKPMRDNQICYKDLVERKHLVCDICLQPKFDGCSVAVDFATGRFFTRGDYDDGTSVDVTDIFSQHFDTVKSYAIDGTSSMKFEAILPIEIFQQNGFYQQYRRPRDVVAATITSRNVDFAKYITLIPLRGYWNQEQYVPSILSDSGLCLFCRVDDYSGIDSFVKDRLDDGATVKFGQYTYAIDGVVASPLKLFDEETDITFTDPSKEIAIKILYNVQETKLKSIEYQFGKQGRITPVAILEPVQFDTITVDHVTLSTLQRVVDMQLRHNDTVRIMYNIVPYFLESYHDGDYPIPVPQNCPICGAKLDYLSYKLVRCTNPNCKGLKLGAIIRHAEKMKMIGLGKGLIRKLYDEGMLTSIESLYHLREFDVDHGLRDIEGLGDKSVHNLLNTISNALQEATLSRFLGSLPFNDTDEKTWKQILSTVDDHAMIQSMIDGSFPDFIMSIGYIPNVGTLKIQRIIDGYLRNQSEIQSLMRWIPSKLKSVDYRYGKNKKICMTGTRDADLTNALTECGYEVGGWTNDCVAVIVPSKDFHSAKTQKAIERNIPIYDIREAYDHLIKPF